MQLDYATLMISNVLTGYGCAFIFGLTWLRGRDDVHLLVWSLALVCSSTGIALSLVSPTAPADYLTANEGLVTYLLIGAGFALTWTGVRRFDGRSAAPALATAAAAAAAAGIAYWSSLSLGALPAHALAAMYVGLMIPTGLLSWELLCPRRRPRLPSRSLAGAAFCLFLVTFVVSASLSMVAGPDPMSAEAIHSVQIALVVDVVCTLLGYVGLLAMSGERARVTLERLATVDPLTGIANRRGLAAWVDRHLSQPDRPAVIALLVLDIDRFKLINDHWGHDAGDAVLCALPRTVRTSALRRDDLFARYGGEEFVAVLPGKTIEQAVEIAERIRRGIADEAFHFAGSEIRITVSIGVSAVDPDDRTLEPAISRADAALYAAKQAGRDRVVAA